MSGSLFLQSVVLGILLGGLYALLAAGLTLYFGVMRVVMVAHSAFLILAAYLAWTVTIESDPDWGLGAEYEAILGPIWRIVGASLVAMVVSELIDTEVYHFWVNRITTRFQWARVLVSNAVSVPVDNAIFAVGAFATLPILGDGLPAGVVWDIFVVNLVVKGLVSVISIPLIYVVRDHALTR